MLHISLEIIIILCKYGAFFVLEDDKTKSPSTGSDNKRRDYSEGMFYFSYIFLEHLQINTPLVCQGWIWERDNLGFLYPWNCIQTSFFHEN